MKQNRAGEIDGGICKTETESRTRGLHWKQERERKKRRFEYKM